MRRRRVVGGRGDVGRSDQEESCLRLGTEIKSMETFGGRLEFDDALVRVNLEHPPGIMAIIGDMMFLGKQEKGEYVGDVIFVDIYFVGTKISNIVGRHNSLVAVNLDGMCRWANIVDMSRVGEKIDCALAIKEEEVWVDGGATAMVLSDDNDTEGVTAYGGAIRLSRHGVNLRRRFLVWTDNRSMPKFTACAAADVAVFGGLWRRTNGTTLA